MASIRIHNSINSRQYRGVFWLVLVLAFFLGNSWAGCRSLNGDYPCSQFSTNCPGSATGSCTFLYAMGSSEYLGGCSSTTVYCRSSGASVYCLNPLVCTDKCSADSVKCINKGYLWNSAGCYCDDPQICAPDKAACENFGGRWSGTTRSDGEGGLAVLLFVILVYLNGSRNWLKKRKIYAANKVLHHPLILLCVPLFLYIKVVAWPRLILIQMRVPGRAMLRMMLNQ